MTVFSDVKNAQSQLLLRPCKASHGPTANLSLLAHMDITSNTSVFTSQLLPGPNERSPHPSGEVLRSDEPSEETMGLPVIKAPRRRLAATNFSVEPEQVRLFHAPGRQDMLNSQRGDAPAFPLELPRDNRNSEVPAAVQTCTFAVRHRTGKTCGPKNIAQDSPDEFEPLPRTPSVSGQPAQALDQVPAPVGVSLKVGPQLSDAGLNDPAATSSVAKIRLDPLAPLVSHLRPST